MVPHRVSIISSSTANLHQRFGATAPGTAQSTLLRPLPSSRSSKNHGKDLLYRHMVSRVTLSLGGAGSFGSQETNLSSRIGSNRLKILHCMLYWLLRNGRPLNCHDLRFQLRFSDIKRTLISRKSSVTLTPLGTPYRERHG